VRQIRIGASIAAAALCVVVLASVGGCSSAQAGGRTLTSAKAETISVEKQIAKFVPSTQVSNTQLTKNSKVIFSCTGHENQSYWPGSMTLNLKSGVNSDTVLQNVADNWTSRTGWSVFKVTGSDGNPSLDIKSSSGSSFTVEFAQGPVFTVNALSACFDNSGLSGRSNY
jgi:hypothetical protein